MYNFRLYEDRQRFYHSRSWRRLREAKFAIDPLCERCQKLGQFVPGEDIHHKIDIRDRPDLALEYSNLETLCKKCHSQETAQGTNRGNQWEPINKKWS